MPRAVVPVAVVAALAAGCAVGPRAVETGRLRYNQAVKSTTEQQLLLNIVRLRYTEAPSNLAVASIADQKEVVAALQLAPFFTSAAAGDVGGFQSAVVPGVELTRADRPTISYDPQDDLEFTRRLFTPISLEGITYLGKTTWPISTTFRLFLENLNWVSNAQSASGPTPRQPPEYDRFRAGVDALQRLQDRNLAVLTTQERDDPQTDPVPESAGTPGAAVEAVKAGCEYRKAPGGGWAVVRKKFQPVLRVADLPGGDADFTAFARAFRLDPAKRSFDITGEKVDPFLANTPEKGLDKVDLETRSLLQVLFFVSHGVDVPAADLAGGVAPSTADGRFDWQQVLGGLFKVECCPCSAKDPPPACAAVAVQYRGHWFYVDARDRDTKATFALLVELTRLDVGGGKAAPILTLPLGGR